MTGGYGHVYLAMMKPVMRIKYVIRLRHGASVAGRGIQQDDENEGSSGRCSIQNLE